MSESRHILFCVGVPASGKSTFAKALVRENQKYKRVNKDALRFLLHDDDFTKFDPKQEKFVVAAEDNLIRQALKEGFNVVVDDTNIEVKHFDRVCRIAESFALDRGISVTVQVKVFDTPLDECLRRNALRVGRECVPEGVIRKMHTRLTESPLRKEKGTTFAGVTVPRPYTRGLPECIVTDMDGTASLLNGRNPYDAKGCINDLPNRPVIELLRDFQHRCAIVVVSGREDKDQEETEQWLRNQGLRFTGDHDGREGIVPTGIVAVHLRKTGDQRKDAVIKREIYEQHILPFFNVRFVLDDRQQVVDAIRSMGVPVFQVAPGDF